MSNEIEVKEKQDLMVALKNSLYPGASDEACELVLAFCRAAGMNPILKPVHIVPMWSSKQQKNVDTIMPGIGMYRINASNSNQYAGLSEPEFGPDVTEEFPAEQIEKEWNGKKSVVHKKAMKLTYPKWCKISVRKFVGDKIVEFVAKEFWKENYATAGRDSIQPNDMWTSRPYGQLAKCAEAQALRKGFPDRVSSQPTAEEMESKFSDFVGQVVESEPAKEPFIEPKTKSSKKESAKETAELVVEPKPEEPAIVKDVAETISPEEREAVQLTWNERVKGTSEAVRNEFASDLKKKYGFKMFGDVKKKDLLSVIEDIQNWEPS